MAQFFKYVLATIIGMFLFFLVLIFLGIGIGSVFSTPDVTTVKSNSVLEIGLNRQIVENGSEQDPFQELINPGGPGQVGLVQLKEGLANAKLDPNIKGVFLKVEYPMAGMATMEEIRKALLDFKESGKFIYSYGEVMSEGALYLSSAGDEIIINPAGGLEFNGLNADVTFLSGMFKKVGIEPVIFKVGEFKSAIEPYTRTSMSAANKKQVSSFLGDISEHFYGQIAESRGISKERVNEILNMPKLHTPEDAKEYGIITQVAYYDEVETMLRKSLEIDEDDKINFISLGKYSKAKKHVTLGDRNNRIAVIVGQGNIVSGKGVNGVIASQSWIKELRKAVKSKKVKAIVLRINSGGGSALASDVMWREIQEAKKVKPVIASMGDYAASGGYYMAMGCDTIVANPTTLTGSIGIFGMLFNTSELMNDKLGITFDGVKTHEYADFPTLTRKMSSLERDMLQMNVEKGYEKFTSKAAAGRGMEINDLKAIASGRVWTGNQAKENGLVDVLGTLDDAIHIAAEIAEVEDFRVSYFPKPKTQIELIVEQLENSSQVRFEEYFGTLAPQMKQVQEVLKMDKLQARLPYEISIQ